MIYYLILLNYYFPHPMTSYIFFTFRCQYDISNSLFELLIFPSNDLLPNLVELLLSPSNDLAYRLYFPKSMIYQIAFLSYYKNREVVCHQTFSLKKRTIKHGLNVEKKSSGWLRPDGRWRGLYSKVLIQWSQGTASTLLYKRNSWSAHRIWEYWKGGGRRGGLHLIHSFHCTGARNSSG